MANAATTAGLVSLICIHLGGAVQAQSFDQSAFTDSDSIQQQGSLPQDQDSSSSTENPNPLQDPRDRIYYPGDTENLKPLSRKLLGNILLDQKEIWTSPFHMHSGDAKWWIGFGAATAALVATDHQTSTLLENSKGQVSWSDHLSNIGTSYTLLPAIAGFYGVGIWRDDAKARETGILGTEALLDSMIVVGVLKPIAGRNRPDDPKEPLHFFDGGTSFPSGHAIQSWAVASVIAHEYADNRIVPILAYALAGVVSAARFTAQKHYASDIVAGGAMGWFIGRYVWKTHQDHALHRHALNAVILPRLEPSSGTYGVALNLGR